MNEKYCLGHNGFESGAGYPRRRSWRSSRRRRVRSEPRERNPEREGGREGSRRLGVAGVSYRLGLRDCREGITTMAPGTSNLKDKHFLTFLRSSRHLPLFSAILRPCLCFPFADSPGTPRASFVLAPIMRPSPSHFHLLFIKSSLAGSRLAKTHFSRAPSLRLHRRASLVFLT